MTCAWCGAPTPEQRRGRKGILAFCPAPAACYRDFDRAAWRIGCAFLARGPETGETRAKQSLAINAGRSAGDGA